jgi:hypothetical protein
VSLKKWIVGYIVIPLSRDGVPQFFPATKAAPRAGEWEWIARVRSDGTVTAGDQADAGVCGMGLGGRPHRQPRGGMAQ